tara:strand:- start:337 stop:1338 length:1002 start_codon:yes stop_codon:yes gene_type:complete
MEKELIKFKDFLKESRKVVITSHRNPDGDAIGSSLAVYHLLKDLGKEVSVITPNDYASFLKWLPGCESIIEHESDSDLAIKRTQESDLIIMLDFNQLYRTGDYSEIIKKSDAKKILIDHHQEPDLSIADIIFSDPKCCSTAQLLFEIIEGIDMKERVTKDIAECLYVGILTDTGSFKYPSVNENTHLAISFLIKKGAEHSKIHDLIFDNFSSDRIQLLGYCLNKKLRLYPDKKSAIISLNDKELKRFNFKKGDTEGIVNYPLSIGGIFFSVFIVEKDGIVKLSLRSKGDIDVNKFARKYFNGGGHINAAGGMSKSSVEETIKKVEEVISLETI